MDTALSGLKKPKFRDAVVAVIDSTTALIRLGRQECSFEFSEPETAAVDRLLANLRRGGMEVDELALGSTEIAEKVPPLLADLDRLRLLRESDTRISGQVCSGIQLYREVHRLADRVLARIAKSSFLRALREGRATREQLIGYALEYHAIVRAAPALIGPALGSRHSVRARALMENFLRSELGHDRLLSSALAAVGVAEAEMDLHQPLPSTFSICAALGVYGRQHPLTFDACLFLFERPQPDFMDAFNDRCRQLGLPEAFYAPLRAHATINDEHDHGDISRQLLELEVVVDAETCTVVKRHVAIMVETLVQQEEEILGFYGRKRERIARLFA